MHAWDRHRYTICRLTVEGTSPCNLAAVKVLGDSRVQSPSPCNMTAGTQLCCHRLLHIISRPGLLKLMAVCWPSADVPDPAVSRLLASCCVARAGRPAPGGPVVPVRCHARAGPLARSPCKPLMHTLRSLASKSDHPAPTSADSQACRRAVGQGCGSVCGHAQPGAHPGCGDRYSSGQR